MLYLFLELNQAVTSASRLAVLQDLFQLVGDHDPVVAQKPSSSRRAHVLLLDSLIKAGAVNALCLQLGFVLNKCDPCLEDMICRAIGLLYQCCSASVREESLHEIGSELFGLLQKAISSASTSSEALRQEVMTIWHVCAESTFGSTLLLRQHGLLALVVDALCDDKGDSGNVQLETLGVLKHVTYFAEDHRLRILEQPGLIPMLCKIPFQARPDKNMERTSAIFRNLALSPNTRLIMANQSDIITALVRLTHGFSQRTARNVMSTLNSLILEAECCLTLIMHGDGILLNVLSRFLSCDEEDDKVVRRRAARIVRFMARDSCLPLMIAHEDLVESLSTCAVSDPSIEVRMEAAEAFARCSTVINAPMPQHTAVLESFTHLAVQPETLCELVARVLKEQASRPTNRTPMANHDGLLDALAKIAIEKSSSRQAKDDAINALYSLSCEKCNLEKMATPAVLNALMVQYTSRGATSRREETSMKMLMNLAAIPSSRKAIVTQDGMLNMLVQYAATTADASTKATIKQTILWLVPLL
jgi:hypothetical protein